jgi:hypothetical protein
LDIEQANPDFKLSHVNTILAIGTIFTFMMFAVWLYFFRNMQVLFEDMGMDLPYITRIAVTLSSVWYIGLIPILVEVLLWLRLRKSIYLVYVNALFLAAVPCMSILFMIAVCAPLFRLCNNQ